MHFSCFSSSAARGDTAALSAFVACVRWQEFLLMFWFWQWHIKDVMLSQAMHPLQLQCSATIVINHEVQACDSHLLGRLEFLEIMIWPNCCCTSNSQFQCKGGGPRNPCWRGSSIWSHHWLLIFVKSNLASHAWASNGRTSSQNLSDMWSVLHVVVSVTCSCPKKQNLLL